MKEIKPGAVHHLLNVAEKLYIFEETVKNDEKGRGQTDHTVTHEIIQTAVKRALTKVKVLDSINNL